ncbi:hypothetical protein CRV08_10085 [Halarcobacter ebronensis]|uniref:Uncharacterized protein n=1 Tax=Halarcobacter ebronensis TaxID=1462615 RepID=A0A4V1LRC4_9BACT|nr:hypothetical protein [Halarcobacter ebronensis]RXJ67708.1 hypothetical protein CRV08_10085 [Halarcobacter ebronensis]
MEKEKKIQKKKTTLHMVLELLFKILLVLAIIIFTLVMYQKFNFNTQGFDFSSTNKSKTEPNMPSELKWFDDFKGIENVPDKNQKDDSDEPKNFLQYESQKNKK